VNAMLTESVDALVATIEDTRATNPDLEEGLEELLKAAPGYRKAEDYFNDDVPEVFASIRLRRAIERTGVDYKVNFARVPVTAVANRLEISSITCPKNPEATAWIQTQWENNQLDLGAPNIHLRGGEYGDAFVIVWPSSEDADDLEDDELADDDPDMPEETRDSPGTEGRDSVEITYNSPLCVRILYDPENQRRKRFAIKKWALSGKRWRVDLIYRDRLEKYITRAGVESPTAADFVIYTDDADDEWPYPNPYDEVPVFHFRTDVGPYGTPDHEGFYGTQQILRKLIVTHMATVDYQGFPQRFALTAEGSDTSEAAAGDEDEFSFAEPTTGATRQQSGEAMSQFTADPGGLWFMRGVRQAGTFPEADPEVFMKPMLQYLRMGAQAAETPVRLFDFASGQLPSGASQVQQDGPFVKKCRNRTLSFGATWRELWQFALRVAGFGRVPVSVSWAPVQHVSGKEGWETLLLQIKAGVPVRQAFSEAGYTDEQITAWLGEEESDIPARLDLLQRIGEVLQAFAGVTALELIPAEQVRELVGAVLEIAPELAGRRDAA
jgi:hypothetical protein